MRLGVDFGTSHTVAVLSRPDGRSDALLFDASPLLPSAVFADPGGALLTGRDAERSARLDPAAYEPHPKRRIDDVALFLGGRDVRVVELVAAVLRRVADEATRAAGRPIEATVLTHPTGWGPQRRSLLLDAAARAGLPAVALVAEPVAAAMYFTTVLGHHVPDGHAIVVYDFGGGTFDISVVRRSGTDWEVVAAQGLDDVGGVDLDATIVDWVGRQVTGGDAELWKRLEAPQSTPDRRHRRALWEDARAVKELLSRATAGGIAVPLFDVDLHLTRTEFEILARPWLDRTVTLTTATMFTSGVSADRLAGVFLVGGASRVPLVATLLHRALGVAPVVLEQPELVVALGSLLAAPTAPVVVADVVAEAPVVVVAEAPVVVAAAPVVVAEEPVVVADEPVVVVAEAPVAPRRRRVNWLLAVIGAIVVLGLLGTRVLDHINYPPIQTGFFAPFTPKPLLVLLAMTLTVAAAGRSALPAYRALIPALIAIGGGLAVLVAGGTVTLPGPALRFADGTPFRLADSYVLFSEGVAWTFVVFAVALVAGAAVLLVRPPRRDAIDPPAGRPRWIWAVLWAAAGAALLLATDTRQIYRQHDFIHDRIYLVSPISGVAFYGGAMSWYAAFTLGLLLSVGPWLLAGAALRGWVAGRARLRLAARALAVAAGALALLLMLLEILRPGTIYTLTMPYWRLFSSDGLAWPELLVTLGVGLGIAIPSYLRSRRAGSSLP
ncbi:Hsp70 family protein [Dactylosporangium sp. CA-092794]|uniref:Hsp70 family protein n=1 Tax=Dactylosporangium sp. CA-092794 TaxID=3239929 RepID=UPI003D931821